MEKIKFYIGQGQNKLQEFKDLMSKNTCTGNNLRKKKKQVNI